jgi:hypothetical protein
MHNVHAVGQGLRLRRLAATAALALAALVWLSVPATAGSLVDPATLQPVPPPDAVCRDDGEWIICHTALHFEAVNQAIFDLPCGTVYETSIDDRSGIRWYNAEGRLAKRFVTQDLEGTWSLSPSGAGPTVTVSAHVNWRNVYAVPGEDADGPATSHGDGLTIRAAGVGVITHIAGIDLIDGTHHGAMRGLDDPGPLCAALTA